MPDYSAKAASTAVKIAAKGRAATLYVQNPQTASKWDPDYDPETGTTVQILTLEAAEEVSTDTNRLIKWEKVMLAVSPVDLDPKVDDEILAEGVRKTIYKLKPFMPGGVVIFWEAEIALGG